MLAFNHALQRTWRGRRGCNRSVPGLSRRSKRRRTRRVAELGSFGFSISKNMKTVLFSLLICLAICLYGCIQRSSVEQRVVELPMSSTNATLATAAKIGQAWSTTVSQRTCKSSFPVSRHSNCKVIPHLECWSLFGDQQCVFPDRNPLYWFHAAGQDHRRLFAVASHPRRRDESPVRRKMKLCFSLLKSQISNL